MSASNGYVLVDDADPRIQYSSGWQFDTNGAEIDGTKHGASLAGMTASLNFTGTQVIVVGSLGSVDVYGVPTTLYTLDGSDASTYTAPIVVPGTARLNVTFFTSSVLPLGSHTLTITNINGTQPNVFWLDYILYDPNAASTSASASLSQISISSSGSTAAASLQTGSASGTGSSAASSQTGDPSGTSSPAAHKSSNAGAIAGGVVGGVVALVLAICLFVFVSRRRRRTGSPGHLDEIKPYSSWRDSAGVMASAVPPSLYSPIDAATPESVEGSTVLLPPSSSFPSTPFSPPRSSSAGVASGNRDDARAEQSSLSAKSRSARREEPPVSQALDSGYRARTSNPAGETVLLPPPYTPD